MGELLSKKTPVTETSTTQTTLPQWLTDASKGAVDFAKGIPDYVPFTGEGVAGLNGLLEQAFSKAGTAGGQFTGSITDAINSIRNGMNFSAAPVTSQGIVDAANPLLDANTKNVINASNTEIDRAKAQELERVASRSAMGGAFSGGRMDTRAALAENDASRNFEDIRAKTNSGLLSDAWTRATDTARSILQGNQGADISSAGVRNNTAGTVGNLAQTGSNMNWNDVTGLLGAGGVQRGIDQEKKTFDYNEFLRGVDSPFKKLQAMMMSMQGPHNTTQTGSTTKEMHSSPLGQMIGAGLGLAGMMGTGGMGSLFNMGYGLLNGGNGYYGGSPTTNPNLRPM
jgi:hypothetical protein